MIVFLEKYSDISILYVSYAFLIRLRFRLILTPMIWRQEQRSYWLDLGLKVNGTGSLWKLVEIHIFINFERDFWAKDVGVFSPC